MVSEISQLIQKELLVEWRQKYAINGILLYLVSSILVVYLSFNLRQNELSVPVWNALFWIIMLFSSVNAVAKSFIQEPEGRLIYLYSIASPQAVIISKLIYNIFLMILLGVLGFGVYSIIMGFPPGNTGLFLINIILAAIGFSSTLTLVSGIASKASASATLMAILSFPVIIPILLMVIRISKNALDGLAWSVSFDELGVLIAINAMITAVSYLLFPYLWRS